MIRYWFEFDYKSYGDIPAGLQMGCGVTAFSHNQALKILTQKVFKKDIPPILKCVENIDVSTLDASHVLPNMRPPIYLGIWFPIGYE